MSKICSYNKKTNLGSEVENLKKPRQDTATIVWWRSYTPFINYQLALESFVRGKYGNLWPA